MVVGYSVMATKLVGTLKLKICLLKPTDLIRQLHLRTSPLLGLMLSSWATSLLTPKMVAMP